MYAPEKWMSLSSWSKTPIRCKIVYKVIYKVVKPSLTLADQYALKRTGSQLLGTVSRDLQWQY
jgi:hypothetical protein